MSITVALGPVALGPVELGLVEAAEVEADRRQTSLQRQSLELEDLESLVTEACSAALLAAFAAYLVEMDQAAAIGAREVY